MDKENLVQRHLCWKEGQDKNEEEDLPGRWWCKPRRAAPVSVFARKIVFAEELAMQFFVVVGIALILKVARRVAAKDFLESYFLLVYGEPHAPSAKSKDALSVGNFLDAFGVAIKGRLLKLLLGC